LPRSRVLHRHAPRRFLGGRGPSPNPLVLFRHRRRALHAAGYRARTSPPADGQDRAPETGPAVTRPCPAEAPSRPSSGQVPRSSAWSPGSSRTIPARRADPDGIASPPRRQPTWDYLAYLVNRGAVRGFAYPRPGPDRGMTNPPTGKSPKIKVGKPGPSPRSTSTWTRYTNVEQLTSASTARPGRCRSNLPSKTRDQAGPSRIPIPDNRPAQPAAAGSFAPLPESSSGSLPEDGPSTRPIPSPPARAWAEAEAVRDTGHAPRYPQCYRYGAPLKSPGSWSGCGSPGRRRSTACHAVPVTQLDRSAW